jgi:hypothetical protein
MMRNRRKLTPQQLTFIAFVSAPLLIAATTLSAPMNLKLERCNSNVERCNSTGLSAIPKQSLKFRLTVSKW